MKREEAIKWLSWALTSPIVYGEYALAIQVAIEALQDEAVQGEWIHDGQNFKGGIDWCHCSECGYRTSTNGLSVYRFCPNCGARMIGGDSE